MKEIFKKTGLVSIIEALIFLILGIILVWKPDEVVNFISTILGIIFIIAGIYKIASYFVAKGNNEFYNYDLVYGIMAIIIGIIIMVYINIIGSAFRIIIGIWIIYTSLVRLNSAIKIKKLGSKVWIYSLAIAMLIFLCGLYVVINSGAIVATIGTIMIIYAIMDIIEDIIIMKNLKELIS